MNFLEGIVDKQFPFFPISWVVGSLYPLVRTMYGTQVVSPIQLCQRIGGGPWLLSSAGNRVLVC